jgi:hypothetical protein
MKKEAMDESEDEKIRRGIVAFVEYERHMDAGNGVKAMICYDNASRVFNEIYSSLKGA